MARREILLPHTNPPGRIIIEDNREQVLAQITTKIGEALAGVGYDVIDRARETGTYQNRTGNLRRMITPNMERVNDDPTSYPATKVEVTESDGREHVREQYTPPGDFDKAKVENTSDGVRMIVGAIMPYAEVREANGDDVLTKAVHETVADANRVLGEAMNGSVKTRKV